MNKNENLKNLDRKLKRINVSSKKLQICKEILIVPMWLVVSANFPVDGILVSDLHPHMDIMLSWY